MKNIIKNDDAISVVVGSILILAVLMTFMSVVASTWVPIYERNAEAGHGDELFDTFLDLRKQMENADEFPKISTVSLGTEEMPLMKNTNSVGRLELDESAGTMALTSTIYYSSSSSNAGETLNINNLNTSDDDPILELLFNFTLDMDTPGHLPDDFEVRLQSITIDRLRITIEEHDDGDELEIEITYDGQSYHDHDHHHHSEEWRGRFDINSLPDGIVMNSDGNNTYLTIDMLNTAALLEIREPDHLTINGTTYHDDHDDEAPLPDLIQHYLKLPADGTYDLEYRRFDQVTEGTQTLLYETTEGTIGGTEPHLDLLEIGGGILTMESDYNFMVDQSYIYESGAVILQQEDGAIFKVEPPIFVDSDSVTDDLIISFQTVVLAGDRTVSGNGLESIQTVLANPEYMASGLTDEITITKDTTSELYDLWHSYFSDLGEFVNSTSANSTDISNETINQVGINIYSSGKNIFLTVQSKEIAIT